MRLVAATAVRRRHFVTDRGIRILSLGQISEKNVGMRIETILILNFVLKFLLERACFHGQVQNPMRKWKRRRHSQ